MTMEQKQAIEAMRYDGMGFSAISKKLGLSRETVKTHCRRNNLSTTVLQNAGIIPIAFPMRKPAFDDHAPRIVCKVTVVYEDGDCLPAII